MADRVNAQVESHLKNVSTLHDRHMAKEQTGQRTDNLVL